MTAMPELHGYHVHIYYNDETLPIADFSVFNDTFPLQGFSNQDWALVA